jgi:hypothetical protein
MSLRAFHLVFIAVSVALSAFVAAWGLRHGAILLSAIFFACGVALIAYGVHAVRKFRELE